MPAFTNPTFHVYCRQLWYNIAIRRKLAATVVRAGGNRQSKDKVGLDLVKLTQNPDPAKSIECS